MVAEGLESPIHRPKAPARLKIIGKPHASRCKTRQDPTLRQGDTARQRLEAPLLHHGMKEDPGTPYDLQTPRNTP